MYETYRMLGAEHEADLERDARKWRRAAEVRGSRESGRLWHRLVTAFLLRIRTKSVRPAGIEPAPFRSGARR